MNYLLIGPQQYLKFQFLERLKKSTLRLRSGSMMSKVESSTLRLRSGSMMSKVESSILRTDQSLAADFDLFETGEKEFTKILDALRTQPFMSKKRLVLIKDIDKFSPKAKDSVLKYLNSPRDSTILVLESSSSELDGFLKEVARFTKTVRCNRLKEIQVNLWIKKEFFIRRKHISLPCADLVRELAGEDLFLLENEIEKITSFAGDAKEITEFHIEAVLGEGAYKTAFELVDLILEKRLGKVLRSLDGLLTNEKPHGILNLLAWQFRNFIKLKGLSRGFSLERVSRTLDINPGFARKVMEQEKRFTRQELEKNLEIILEADFLMKKGKVDPRHALERALVLLCSQV